MVEVFSSTLDRHFEFLDVNYSLLVHGNMCYFISISLKKLADVHHRHVLDRSGDYMISFLSVTVSKPLKRQIVCL